MRVKYEPNVSEGLHRKVRLVEVDCMIAFRWTLRGAACDRLEKGNIIAIISIY